jgi:hypothetical protein
MCEVARDGSYIDIWTFYIKAIYYLVEAAGERVLVELEYLEMVEQLARLQKHLHPDRRLRREERRRSASRSVEVGS